MTLIEHIRELRNRLFKASLAILVGLDRRLLRSSQPVFDILQAARTARCPRRSSVRRRRASSSSSAPADGFLLKLKIALWVGLIVAAPVWLYQLWAFIAPGLHRHERKYGLHLRRRSPRRCSRPAPCWPTSWSPRACAFLLDAGVDGDDHPARGHPLHRLRHQHDADLRGGVRVPADRADAQLRRRGQRASGCSAGGGSRSSCSSCSPPWSRPTPDPFGMTRAGALPVGAVLRRGRRGVPQRPAHAAAARRSTPASTTTRSRRSRTTASRSTAGRAGSTAGTRSTRREPVASRCRWSAATTT